MYYAPLDIDTRMTAAESTLRRLPAHVMRGYLSSWPEIAWEPTEHGRGLTKANFVKWQ